MFHIWAYFSWWFCTHSPHPHPSRYSGTLHFDTWKDSITHNRKEVLFLPSQPMLPLQTKFSEQQQQKKTIKVWLENLAYIYSSTIKIFWWISNI